LSGSRETARGDAGQGCAREVRDRGCAREMRERGCAREMRERGCALERLREREHVQAWGCNGEWLSWTRD